MEYKKKYLKYKNKYFELIYKNTLSGVLLIMNNLKSGYI